MRASEDEHVGVEPCGSSIGGQFGKVYADHIGSDFTVRNGRIDPAFLDERDEQRAGFF